MRILTTGRAAGTKSVTCSATNGAASSHTLPKTQGPLQKTGQRETEEQKRTKPQRKLDVDGDCPGFHLHPSPMQLIYNSGSTS